MENQVTILTVYCVKEIENIYFKTIHEFVKCFSAHQCKNNCQTKLILFKLAPKSPIEPGLPGLRGSQNLNRRVLSLLKSFSQTNTHFVNCA